MTIEVEIKVLKRPGSPQGVPVQARIRPENLVTDNRGMSAGHSIPQKEIRFLEPGGESIVLSLHKARRLVIEEVGG